MIAATHDRALELTRLLVIEREGGAYFDAHVHALPALLRPGDVMIVNDAATLPASLHGRAPDGSTLELRLLADEGGGEWTVFLLGAGDWRTPTEDRPSAHVNEGERLAFGAALSARVLSKRGERLARVAFDGDLYTAIYARGRPVQYAHLREPLDLWTVQTPYASRPWAMEMPSAGRPLTLRQILALRSRGIAVHALTHAAGLSSSGEAALDACLPLRERYDIPALTADAVNNAQGRVVAVGTSVVRALESSAKNGCVVAGEGITELRIDAAHRLQVVDGLLTGIHEPSASHFALLAAFTRESRLFSAYAHAERAGYLGHELGDLCLIF